MAKPPRQSGRKVTFTPEAAQRIARAVVAVEKGDRSIAAPGRQSAGSDGEIIRGKFSGAWDKGSKKTVTDATLSAVTYEAKNYLADFKATGQVACEIAYSGGEWVLVSAEFTTVTIISDVKIVGSQLRFSTAKVNVFGTAFGDSYIDIPLESC
jgi:hypothetical protein